jgi:glycosyltransferase involved in cell wall biosynthesis
VTLVSVIVPVHDGERYLKEALDSVLAQDYRPVEVIVVDDGSTDRSAEIARSVPGVTVISQDQGGPSAARNAGIARARGEFVAFLDADDLMLPHKLTVQVGHLIDHPEVGCTLARQVIRVEEGVEPPAWLRRDRRGDRHLPVSSIVVRTAALRAIRGFDESLWRAEDQDLLFRLRADEVQIELLPDVLLTRRIHGSNLTYQQAATQQALLSSIRGRLLARRERPR